MHRGIGLGIGLGIKTNLKITTDYNNKIMTVLCNVIRFKRPTHMKNCVKIEWSRTQISRLTKTIKNYGICRTSNPS